MDTIEKSSSKYMVVVAIDFGTTYSGYAFSFKTRPLDIRTNQSWSKNLISLKTPTVLLLNQNRKFDSFGFEAEMKYSELLEDGEAEGWALFRRFKMKLYADENLSMKTEITDLSGTVKMPAIEIFAMAIRYLKDHALSTFNNPARPELHVRDDDVYFVLTVPAIWDDKARLFMREAAVEAGIPRQQIGMALESEAASIWCQAIPSIVPNYNIASVGSKYMVVDLGGGTADIAVHHKLQNGKLRELAIASGGDWGGTQVDKRFMAMLAYVLGESTMRRFQKECLSDVFDLLKEFETAKRMITPESTGMIKIRLPAKLHEINLEEQQAQMSQSQIRKQFASTINSSTHSDKLSIRGDKLRIDAEFAREMFSFSIRELCSHVKDLYEIPEVASVDAILVVGGFSECSLVQYAFQESFSDKKLIFPSEAGLAVLKGAVLFGHKPEVIESRRSRFTYGLKRIVDFDKEIHDPKQRINVRGVEKCNNVFDIYVRKGAEIHAGYTVSEKHVPSDDEVSGGYTSFSMYISTDTSPTYVTEPTCQKLGTLDVRMPEDDNKAYETSFVFGDTEIMLVVKHLHSGKLFSKYFNFY